MLSSAELKNLKSKLPKKPIQTISEKLLNKGLTYSEVYIRQVLKGERFNLDIINAAIELRDEYQKALKKVKEKLKS